MSKENRTDSFVSQLRALALLAGPLVANNLAIAGMGFADTVMAGRLGTTDLAAVALGSNLWMVAFLFGLGVLMAMSPTAAQSFGAGKSRDVGIYTRQCLWLSQALALISMFALSRSEWLLFAVGVDRSVIPLTVGYLDAISWGLPAMYAYLSLRFMSEGIGWTRPIAYVAVLALLANVFLNWVFMFGKLGFPAWGAIGCGASSAVTMWIMLATMTRYVSRHSRYRSFALLERFDPPNWRRLRELLALGLPITASVLSEVGLFSAVGLMMGTLGATVVAAHQIAINYSGVMFMVPLAIHSALTIRVAHAVGRGEVIGARRTGFLGIATCGAVMLFSAVTMLIFREHIASFYSQDAVVGSLAISLLGMAMFFQVSDGLQVGAAGALRGYKDTRVPMLLNFGSYWLVAFPLAWYLGIVAKLGPKAIWIAIIVGLTMTAVLLNARFHFVSKRRIEQSGEKPRQQQ
jgi:MATE family multidrug resistance protein